MTTVRNPGSDAGVAPAVDSELAAETAAKQAVIDEQFKIIRTCLFHLMSAARNSMFGKPLYSIVYQESSIHGSVTVTDCEMNEEVIQIISGSDKEDGFLNTNDSENYEFRSVCLARSGHLILISVTRPVKDILEKMGDVFGVCSEDG